MIGPYFALGDGIRTETMLRYSVFKDLNINTINQLIKEKGD
jgi:hypothetical protein